MRLADIAAHCNVSLSTVSRALSGTPGVKPEVRELILATAREKNYHQPISMAGRRVAVLASASAMIDYQRNQFTTYVLEGIRARAAALDMELMTRGVSGSEGEAAFLAEAAEDESLSGLLFLTVDDYQLLSDARAIGKPIVLVNGDDPTMQFSSVAPHNRGAAAVATRHLISLGHRRILFCTRSGRRTIQRRRDGWHDELPEELRATSADLVAEAEDWTPDAARAAIKSAIEAGIEFTAVLCAADTLAIGAIHALQEAGLSVPDDVSVVGIDGLPQGELVEPALTSVHVPMRSIGEAAVDLIREHFVDAGYIARRLELSCRLIVRSSDGPARN